MVREHIHLKAIQKMVYIKLERTDLLAMIDQLYRENQGPYYKHAWEIVNDIESLEVVVNDIMRHLK